MQDIIEEFRNYAGENAPNSRYFVQRYQMPGIFHIRPSLKEEPFVKVGSRVKTGDLVCIIEAMKMMNEVVAEASGVVVAVYAENEKEVGLNQNLILIDKGA